LQTSTHFTQCLCRIALRLGRIAKDFTAAAMAGDWNHSVTAKVNNSSAQQKVNAMQLGYYRPFSFQIGPRPETKIASLRHGVTEVTLSDGRLVRATLHVTSVKTDPNKPGAIDLSYNIIAEVMTAPQAPIRDVHETIQ
jgi:hypothetical protein